ncbi:restriction endonuclease subunit S [Clostridium sp. C8]|uniref:restriction endonuclease subunit S n=1 Tax=Clostridium sp. C8 TaxID=1667357 RepID=UPI00069C0472|nr:restriction endonuclease subunit S [Clostridium sp. C8]
MNRIRDGYKMTELGVIPDEWQIKKLEDIFERITDKNKENESNNVLTISAQMGLVNQEKFFNKNIASKNTENYYLLKKDDFAYNKSYSTGYPMGAIKRLNNYEKGIVSPLYICFRKKNELANNNFYEHFFEHTIFDNAIASIAQEGARNHGLLNVSVSEFFSLPIVFPPVKEQKKIASILSTVDEQIDNVDGLIEKNKELKNGLMQQLLTKGIGHTKFKHTEIGEIPEEWEVLKIGEIAKFQGGYAFRSSDYIDNGINLVKITNVQQKDLIWSETDFLPTEFLDKYSEYRLNIDDVVIAMTRPIISSGIKVCKIKETDIPALLNQRVGRFICSDRVSGKYLYQYCLSNYFINKVSELCSTTGQPNVSSNQIESIMISLPSINEQEEIESILSEVDRKITEYENKKQKLEELKKGLMQQLLTGKIRTV